MRLAWVTWRLRRFFLSHEGWTTVPDLVRKFPFVSATTMATAVGRLVEEGTIKHYYKVRYEDGNLSLVCYNDPIDVPEIVYDNFNRRVLTASMDIVPVFWTVKANR